MVVGIMPHSAQDQAHLVLLRRAFKPLFLEEGEEKSS
jgi:hypothetical protein